MLTRMENGQLLWLYFYCLLIIWQRDSNVAPSLRYNLLLLFISGRVAVHPEHIAATMWLLLIPLLITTTGLLFSFLLYLLDSFSSWLV